MQNDKDSSLQRLDAGMLQVVGRIAGVILSLAGVLCLVFATFLAYRLLQQPGDNALIFVLVGLAVIAIFGLSVGIRLALWRPNPSGSILGVAGWVSMGVFWAGLAVFLLIAGGAAKMLPEWIMTLLASGWSFWKAAKSRGKPDKHP